MRSSVVKIKKEERMKKLVIIALALLLAVPAVTFAGSATSRWDMTIGGYVKADWGWADQNRTMDDWHGSQRKGTPGLVERPDYEYGIMDARGFDSRLNFLVKGPDAWGAKTSAFVEFDFNTLTGGGAARERHAFMKFDWAQSSLIIGQTWVNYNLVPIPIVLAGVNELGEAKNNRMMQVQYKHMFGKNLSTSIAAIAPLNFGGSAKQGTDYNSATRSMTPYLSGAIDFSSDACGKIGTTKLAFGASGIFGYTKEVYANASPDLTNSDHNVKAWGAAIYTTIPIIPERNNSKAGAWGVAGGAQMFSNIADVLGPVAVGTVNAYARGPLGEKEVAPTYAAWWGTTNFFFTDKVSLNAYYGSVRLTSPSRMFARSAAMTTPVTNDTYALNVAYDVSPAIRLVAEAQQVYTIWATDAGASGADRGKMNVFRLGAWYFF